MTTAERPLEGRVVLVTRPPERAEPLARRLRVLGAQVEARPTFSLEPPTDAEPARRAVGEIERYDWVVFTSANGVRFFSQLLHELQGTTRGLPAAVAAIGPATTAALVELGCPPDLVARDSHSEGLARRLAGSVATGDRVLIVRPETARDVLPRAIGALGATAEAVAFYRNVAHPGVDSLAAELCADRFDVAVFSSPSSLERLVESQSRAGAELLEALGRVRIVAIGPVTARAIERAGLGPPVVAPEPTDEAVERCVRALFE
jgi:uroporphyrinogen III methyltransferase/synthase